MILPHSCCRFLTSQPKEIGALPSRLKPFVHRTVDGVVIRRFGKGSFTSSVNDLRRVNRENQSSSNLGLASLLNRLDVVLKVLH
jgi:hypothetical protein